MSKVAIGEQAPLLDAQFDGLLADGTIGKICLRDYIKQGKYIVLASYPLNFTFVCPSEICSFSDKSPEFAASNCVVVLTSVDSVYSHHAWANTPRNQGGIAGMQIPIIADLTRELGVAYSCLLSSGHHSRMTCIISNTGAVRHISYNDPPAGRNVDEVLRLVEAYQFVDEHGEVCPANWNKKTNNKTIITDPINKMKYFESV